jgi:hypothetical protein
MSRLAGISLILGAVMGMISASMLCCPAQATRGLKAFPRHKLAGAVLACTAIVWATILLMKMNMGFLEKYKPYLLVIAPVVFVLIVFFVDELLAPRALGGLMLLVPAPILAAARWHDSLWRYFAIVSAYVLVIKGISLILSPYLFRQWCSLCISNEGRARLLGGIGLAYSITWIALAFLAY